jgi:hypothetical protein
MTHARGSIVKVADYIHTTHGAFADGMICRVRIFTGGPYPVMLVTELPENTNTCVTHLCECLAAEIAARHRDLFPDGHPFAYIEHHASGSLGEGEQYDRIVFDGYRARPSVVGVRERMTLGVPRWQRMRSADVETLIGEPRSAWTAA